jgi:hypothetical protein
MAVPLSEVSTPERTRVLLLARHFPPIGGAGVQRTIGVLRHLRSHGYEPVVVTGPGGREDRWNPADPELLRTVAGDVEVHRLEGPEPAGRSGWKARGARWAELPAPWVRWWVEGATRLGEEVAHDAQLILASLIPYETSRAAATLSRRLGIPWVADLEDPWAFDEMRVHPTALHREFDLHRMRRGLASASAIVMNSFEAADRVHRRMPQLCDRPVLAIPTGFDPVDFEPGGAAPPAGVDPAAFKIVHTGSMHTQLGLAHRRSRRARKLLGGTSVDVDILTRSHVYLVQAIEQVLERRPDLRGQLQLHLAGTFTDADRAVIDGRSFITVHGHLSHDSTLALMRSADLLFLPLYDLPPGQRAGLIPYKTYEYLAARRPVLGAVPEGDARDFLATFDRASVCRPADVTGMAAAIEERVALASAGSRETENDVAALQRLERGAFMAQLAGVLDGVLADRVRALAAA